MKNILILPEESDSYRALSGDKESTGRTPGQALDALTSQLSEEEATTLVILRRYKPDRFFDVAQQERLAELMRSREAGNLTAEDEVELESLVEAELRGATQRAEAMADAAGQKGFPPPLHEDSYVARVARECLMHEEEVLRQIMMETGDHDLARDVVAAAIQRVIKYAERNGPTKDIRSVNVKALLTVYARTLLIDAQTKRLKADKIETVGGDSTADGSLQTLPNESPTNEIGQDLRDPYLERIARECMAYKAEVERRISLAAHNPALAEDLVAQAIKRVIEYAGRHREEKGIGSVKGLLVAVAHNLLIDARTKRLKADRVETVSWDSTADDSLLNLPDESSTNELERRIEAAELKALALKDAKPAQRELFDMWFERGMTPSEISVQLGVSPAAVRFRIQTLLALMRDSITKHGLS